MKLTKQELFDLYKSDIANQNDKYFEENNCMSKQEALDYVKGELEYFADIEISEPIKYVGNYDKYLGTDKKVIVTLLSGRKFIWEPNEFESEISLINIIELTTLREIFKEVK